MEVTKVYVYRENATLTVNLPERLQLYIQALDRFLKYLKENKSSIYEKYLIALKEKLLPLLPDSSFDLDAIAIPEIQEMIQGFNELQKIYFSYAYQLFEVPRDQVDISAELTWFNRSKSAHYPAYYRALTLCDLIGRTEAIKFIKEYIDKSSYEQIQPNLELKDLNHIYEHDIKEIEKENPHPVEFYAFRIHKGIVGGRADKCLSHEIMKALNDPELAHLVCCYNDKSMLQAPNPNFVFTRTTTLMEGGPYCDTCIHDKRHDPEVKHPDKLFWETLHSKVE